LLLEVGEFMAFHVRVIFEFLVATGHGSHLDIGKLLLLPSLSSLQDIKFLTSDIATHTHVAYLLCVGENY
jgi:hypothetical protein